MDTSIGHEMYEAIRQNLGWETAETLKEVKTNLPNVLDCNETFCIVTCVEDDKPYIEAMVELIDHEGDCKIIVKEKAGRPKAGTGFGDKVWRNNTKHGGIELSFAGKPSEEMRDKMKSLGFRWSHASGVWYISNKKSGENVSAFLKYNGFTQVEDN